MTSRSRRRATASPVGWRRGGLAGRTGTGTPGGVRSSPRRPTPLVVTAPVWAARTEGRLRQCCSPAGLLRASQAPGHAGPHTGRPRTGRPPATGLPPRPRNAWGGCGSTPGTDSTTPTPTATSRTQEPAEERPVALRPRRPRDPTPAGMHRATPDAAPARPERSPRPPTGASLTPPPEPGPPSSHPAQPGLRQPVRPSCQRFGSGQGPPQEPSEPLPERPRVGWRGILADTRGGHRGPIEERRSSPLDRSRGRPRPDRVPPPGDAIGCRAPRRHDGRPGATPRDGQSPTPERAPRADRGGEREPLVRAAAPALGRERPLAGSPGPQAAAATSAIASPAASIVRVISSSPWAALVKTASKAPGARATPRRSIAWKNRA